jgi:hypothetical protein
LEILCPKTNNLQRSPRGAASGVESSDSTPSRRTGNPVQALNPPIQRPAVEPPLHWRPPRAGLKADEAAGARATSSWARTSASGGSDASPMSHVGASETMGLNAPAATWLVSCEKSRRGSPERSVPSPPSLS